MHVPHIEIAIINGEEKGYGCEIQKLFVELREKTTKYNLIGKNNRACSTTAGSLVEILQVYMFIFRISGE